MSAQGGTAAKVLVVDDVPMNVKLLVDLLAVKGYRTCSALSGSQALELLESERPDLVLLDVMMPDLSGPQTLAALRELPSMQGVPVVFMTAKALPDELEDLLQHGATGVIVKPFDPMTLAQDIRPYWEHGRGAGR